jgi:hypothetical protein
VKAGMEAFQKEEGRLLAVIPGGRNRVRKVVWRAKSGGSYYITSVMVTVEYNAMYLIVIDLALISSYGECS